MQKNLPLLFAATLLVATLLVATLLVATLLVVPATGQEGFPPTHRQADVPVPGTDRRVGPSATSVVLPAAYATRMGESANSLPHAHPDIRYQQVFSGTEIGRPLRIQRVCLRLDERFGGPAQRQRIDVFLGTTDKDHNNLTSVFADNYTKDSRQQVFSGILDLPLHSGGAGVNDFRLCISLEPAFLWQQVEGQNLLVEFINRSPRAASYLADFGRNARDCTTARAYAFSQTQSRATRLFRNEGLVIRLDDGSATTRGTYETFGRGCLGGGSIPPNPVVPSAYESKMGTAAPSTIPQAFANLRYQQVVLAPEVGGQLSIEGLCLRLDERFGGPAQEQTLTVTLGHTQSDHTNLGSDFDGNFSPRPRVTVFSGTLNFPAHSGGGNTNSFNVCIKFARSFAYTSPDENLLVEILNSSKSSQDYYLDTCTGADCTTSRVFALGAGAKTATAIRRNEGLVMQLQSPGGAAFPILDHDGAPVLGKSFTVRLSRANPGKDAVLWFGTQSTRKLEACNSYTSLLFGIPARIGLDGTVSLALAIPNSASLIGVTFTNQWWIFDLDGNGSFLNNSVSMTNGARAVIGNR